ncbi:MAG: hypothetical protein QM648_08645 [Solirubrobacterales bacterium]
MLWSKQPTAQRVLGVTLGPIIFGAICGWLVGVSGAIYTVLTLLAILGGLAAGYEHTTVGAGALRGLFIGTLFALTICETHRLIGNDSLANTPDPIELIVPVFAVISAILGTIGATLRRRKVTIRA